MNIRINNSNAFKANKTKKIESLANQTIKKMKNNGQVIELSSKDTSAIDNKLAIAFEKIRNNYFKKINASWNAVKDIIIIR